MPTNAIPILILAVAVGIVFLLIIKLRINAFLALIVAATTVGVLSPEIPLAAVMPRVAELFGTACANIGIVIALAALIGQSMMESGAADRIVRVFVRLLGVERASVSMVSVSGILAIPVFFDTVFYLMVPLARAMRVRTGKNYLLYVMAICAGAAAAHSMVPPTPGPLAMAANLGVDLGVMILAGLVISVPMAIAGWLFSIYADRQMDVPLRESTGASVTELERLARVEDADLPGFISSVLPIALPVVLITSNTVAGAVLPDSPLTALAAFIGNPNFALLISAAVALYVMARSRHCGPAELAKSVETAIVAGGLIILITAAGGSFGGMLQLAGVGDALGRLAQEFSIPVLLMAAILASLFKVAQGSSTVSMMTVSSIMLGLTATSPLGFHPVYLALVIGSGSLVGSWMNDSGFWIFTKMTGLSEAEGLKTWSPLLAVLGVTGVSCSILAAWLFPLI